MLLLRLCALALGNVQAVNSSATACTARYRTYVTW